MDQRELHLQHVGICYKLYHFIMKTLAAQALKTVTLGSPSHYGSSSIRVPISKAAHGGSGSRTDKLVRPETPSCEGVNDKELPTIQGLFGDSLSPPTEHIEEKNNPCRNIIHENEVEGENMGDHQAPKKMVSINDNVEEIILTSKKKRNNSFQKSNSLDLEEQLKLPRSILKVGSNLNDSSNLGSYKCV